METFHIVCECHSPEHTLAYMYDPGSSTFGKPAKWYHCPEMWTEVYLNQYRNIFQRVWVAIKYVFGYKCRYGHFDCTLLGVSEAKKLRDGIDKFITETEEWVEGNRSKLHDHAVKQLLGETNETRPEVDR